MTNSAGLSSLVIQQGTYVCTLNNGNFEEEIPNIYPPELTLKGN